MNEVSKFISMGEEENNNASGENTTTNEGGSTFKVSSSNLPANPTFFTKLKNALFYEIKVELTPYQQKVEDEINDFLHQEITWGTLKAALFEDVVITHKGKRIA